MQYIILFSCFDILALTIQALGGAKAAKAQQDGTSTTSATEFMVRISHSHVLIYRRKWELSFKELGIWYSLPPQPYYGTELEKTVARKGVPPRFPKISNSNST